MTPREVVFAQRGFEWRQEQEQWRISSVVAAIYNVHRDPKKRRKPFTPSDFMPRKKAPGAKTPEAQKALLDGLVARTRHMGPARASSRSRGHRATASARQ